MMEKQLVYEIDPTKKYLIVIDDPMSEHEMQRMIAKLDAWLKSDHPVLLVKGAISLVKVETEDSVEIIYAGDLAKEVIREKWGEAEEKLKGLIR